MDEDPNASGLSRKAIEQELANSLDRLEMETVDSYQTHRWDDEIPIEETIRVLDDAVRREQVRYLGASSMWAYQFADALHTSDRLGLDRFVRCRTTTTWSTARRSPRCSRSANGRASASSPGRRSAAATSTDRTRRSTRRLGEPRTPNRSASTSIPTATVAVPRSTSGWRNPPPRRASRWPRSRSRGCSTRTPSTPPLFGTTSIEHLEDAVEALEIDLSESDIEYLEEPYEPVGVSGHR